MPEPKYTQRILEEKNLPPGLLGITVNSALGLPGAIEVLRKRLATPPPGEQEPEPTPCGGDKTIGDEQA